MKVLVLVEDYPNNQGGVTLMYVHTRNLYYVQHGIDVEVLNFRATENYTYEGVPVMSEDTFLKNPKQYDLLIVHAGNVKNHYRFLKKNGKLFPRFLFFYHGHEVLRLSSVYSKPYPYVSRSRIKEFLQDCYDTFKLRVWRKYLPKVAYKSHFVFVSKWMYDEFLKHTKIPEKVIDGKTSITYNCVGETFEKETYDENGNKEYDFVTVRGNLDGSKYSVDIVNRLAFHTPNAKFLLVGKGEFFNHYEKAPNIEWRNQTMGHKEIIEILQKSRFALMPTRTDAQGLMMCEMSAFGIPVITSDIPVCHEVYDGFDNAYFIDNNDENGNLERFLSMPNKSEKDVRFYKEKTISKELDIIYQMQEKK